MSQFISCSDRDPCAVCGHRRCSRSPDKMAYLCRKSTDARVGEWKKVKSADGGNIYMPETASARFASRKTPAASARPAAVNGHATRSVDAAIQAAISGIRREHPTARETARWTWSPDFVRVRFDLRDGSKQFRPFTRTESGWKIGEPPKPYALYTGAAPLPAEGTVWVVEGEKCADALASVGICAVTSGSSTSADACDWSPLAGREVVICPDNDAPGAKYAQAVAAKLIALEPAASARTLKLAGLGAGQDVADWLDARDGAEPDALRAELERLADAATAAGGRLNFADVSSFGARSIRWLWEGRIPLETLTLLCGSQGATKNLFLYDLIARITNGWDFPDGAPCERGRVILFEAEEHIETQIRPRLDAAGADASRVKLFTEKPTAESMNIRRDAHEIIQYARRMGDVRLICISPISAYMGGVNTIDNEEVRSEVLNPLKEVSESLHCAVILLKHLNKVWKCPDILTRIAGSSAWSEQMRVVMFIGSDPSEEEKNRTRALFTVKHSIMAEPTPLSWRLRFDTGSEHPALDWLTAPVTFTAAESLVGKRKKADKANHAESFILERLATGPMAVNDLEIAAERLIDQGTFSRESLRRARLSLKAQGAVAMSIKPKIFPSEWWIWTPNRPPGWLAGAEEHAP